MSTIVTRAGKGSPLTNTEVDNNFTNLNTDKLESDGSVLADKIAFDTAAALTPTTGQMVWDAETGTVDIGLNGATAPVMSVGEDQFYRVINQTGSTITKGTLVMAFGTVGASGVIKVKAWDGTQASKTIMGLVKADIPTEDDPTESGLGYVLAFGKLKGIQTNGGNYGQSWADGDIIYAGASSGLTKTLPAAPNTKTTIAIVINSHATNGTLFVRPSYGSSLAEDELVQLSGLANADVLSYDSTDGRFENKTLSAAGIYATSNPAGYTTNTGTVTSVGGTGTVNGITLTGTVTSSGNLTLGGTLSGVNLTSQVTGTLPVANGGTGLTALGTSNQILKVNSGATALEYGDVSGGLEYVVKTANYTAVDKQGVLADTSGGAFTVTLPATPATGAQVVVADSGSFWGTNNLTVARNGSTIGGLAENLVCDITGASVQFVYDGSTWEVYAQIGGNGGTAVTLNGMQTLTNKTINGASNTLSVRLANDVSGILPVANGGTGNAFFTVSGPGTTAKTYTFPNASTTILTTNAAVTVAQGGTGATTLTANNVVLGNGTSAVQFVAPGTSGNVLRSNGTTWTSAAVSAGGFSNLVVFTASGSWTVPAGITKAKVTVTGGGGGVTGAVNGSASGAAGGTAIKIVSLSGSSATITIGAGGASGTDGGNSTFVYSATTVTGNGGVGSAAGTFLGGSASGGDINDPGGDGGSSHASGFAGVNGGASFWGSGGRGSGNGQGAGGRAFGSGAGNCGNTFNSSGAAGVIVIEY
jgi:hypothetical protein